MVRFISFLGFELAADDRFEPSLQQRCKAYVQLKGLQNVRRTHRDRSHPDAYQPTIKAASSAEIGGCPD
jgi:hypothetical protein